MFLLVCSSYITKKNLQFHKAGMLILNNLKQSKQEQFLICLQDNTLNRTFYLTNNNNKTIRNLFSIEINKINYYK